MGGLIIPTTLENIRYPGAEFTQPAHGLVRISFT